MMKRLILLLLFWMLPASARAFEWTDTRPILPDPAANVDLTDVLDPMDPQTKCACIPQTPGGLATTFIGMSPSSSGVSHRPTVPTYVYRLWDTQCVWALVNTSNGVENFANCDTLMDDAQAVGAKPDFVFGRTPSWAIAGSCSGSYGTGCAQKTSDLNTTNAILGTFVTDLVNHVKARYPSLTAWYIECVNEADLSGEWATSGGTGHESMQDLVTFCTKVKTTAQAIDPTIIVIGPSASTYNQFGPHLYGGASCGVSGGTGGGYFQCTGMAASMDAVNIHPYFFCGGSNPCLVPETAIAANTQLASAMTAAGISSMPVYMSESDWGTAAANTSSDANKEAWIGRFAMYTYNSGWAGYWWYQWECNSGVLSSCFGTMSGSGVGAVVATSFSTDGTWLIGSRHVVSSCNQNFDGHNTWYCAITSSGNAAQAILFNSAGNQTVTVSNSFTTQDNADGTNQAIVSHQVTAGLIPIRVR